eukprot:TRINITY_DN25351_c0_g1_i1.p2 TRINITY_DN25351_c0_g1~~TRINITY_DN25351_c0_g1_i1.p2  ORF type:complete len:128 (-),score=10.90 TRINITY_DN25351_c0_g1_i1:250-633(-)
MIDFIYGFQAFDKRHSLCYLKQKNSCPEILYYISRFCIALDRKTGIQRFVETEKFKITCICVNEKDGVLAISASSPSPYVQILQSSSFSVLYVIPLCHRNGVIHMKFVSTYLITVACDKNFSVSVLD